MTIALGAQFDPRIIVELFRDNGFGVQIGDDDPNNLIQPCVAIDLNRDRVGHSNTGIIELHNLSDEMKAQIQLGEFTKVLVRSGFMRANNIANIWEGEITKSAPSGAGDRAGCITEIYTTEGDQLFIRQNINMTWPAGTTFLQMVLDVIAKIPDINRGDLSGLAGIEPIRKPYTASGSVREFFDDLSKTTDTRWSIQRTSLDWIANNTISGSFKVISKTLETGLIHADLDEKAVFGTFALDPAADPNAAVNLEYPLLDGVTGNWRLNRVRHHGSVGGGQDCIFTDFTGEKLEGRARRIQNMSF